MKIGEHQPFNVATVLYVSATCINRQLFGGLFVANKAYNNVKSQRG